MIANTADRFAISPDVLMIAGLVVRTIGIAATGAWPIAPAVALFSLPIIEIGTGP